MNIVDMERQSLGKCRAIVRFGPETAMGGMRPAEYYQVIIDPNMISPSGKHIRFGMYEGDEIVGWQRVDAMTVCEVIDEKPEGKPLSTMGYSEDRATVEMMVVV